MKPLPDDIQNLHPNTESVLKPRARRVRRPEALRRPSPSKKGAPGIELYQMEGCPFSHAVRTRLSDMGLDFIAHNVSPGNSLKHHELVQAGGKDQIPILVDHKSGVKLYESDAILTYLDKEYGKPPKSAVQKVAHRIDSALRARADQIAWSVKIPVERYRTLRKDVSESWETVVGSVRFLRSALGRVVDQAKAKAEGAAMDSGEDGI